MVKNNVSISVSKWSTAVSLKKPPKSVSDTDNPCHVACLLVHATMSGYLMATGVGFAVSILL